MSKDDRSKDSRYVDKTENDCEIKQLAECSFRHSVELVYTCLALLFVSFYILGKYRAVGRIIHAKYLKERLVLKSPAFDGKETKEGVALVEQLEILADTLYIQVKFHIEKNRTYVLSSELYCILSLF